MRARRSRGFGPLASLIRPPGRRCRDPRHGSSGERVRDGAPRSGARVRTWSRSSRISPATAAQGVDLVLLAVRDDAIEVVADRLAESPHRRGTRKPVVLHLSGYHGNWPLRALSRRGFPCGSLHPLVPLTGRSSAPDLEAPGSPRARRGGGPRPSRAGSSARSVDGSCTLDQANAGSTPGISPARSSRTATVAVFDAAIAEAGPAAAPALASMLGIVAARLARGPQAALSGPAARGEKEVVAGHLEVLRSKPDEAALYRLLSRRLLALSDLGAAERRAMSALLR